VTEWDFLFHFRTGADVTTGRYKVIFDRQEKAHRFYWQPEACAATATPAHALKRFTLSTDALFGFGRSALADLQPDAQAELTSIAQQLVGAPASLVSVTGYTDRIGDERSNLALSRRRAETVREFLIARGVAEDAIVAVGMGERDPATSCSDALAQADLIACLQPDRRVEILVSGLG
jgi:outer membrane protein OmpA-like peptidoglycan-associated protein